MKFSFLLILFFFTLHASALPTSNFSRFQRQVIDADLVGNYDLRAMDLDSDGLPDLLVIPWGSGLLSWYPNPGPCAPGPGPPCAGPRLPNAHLPGGGSVDAAGDRNGEFS